MAPIVTVVRHAQGIHNLSPANSSMHDPGLTPFGEEQCAELARSFPYHDSVDLLVSSPLRRTIYTTLLAFKQQIPRCGNVIALPEAQEVGDVPADTGSDLEILKKEFAQKPVDLGLLMEDWNIKTGRWASITPALEKRAREAREWLKARPEKHIVLTTHGGFAHYFTEDWTGYKKNLGTGWANVEYRSYQFTEKGDTASVEETAESRERRQGTEKPLTETERNKLRETAETS